MKPLTAAEYRVAELVAQGYEPKRIAAALRLSRKTVDVHVQNIARKLPNPEGLKPYTLVLLEFAHRKWLDLRPSPLEPAA